MLDQIRKGRKLKEVQTNQEKQMKKRRSGIAGILDARRNYFQDDDEDDEDSDYDSDDDTLD